MSTIPSAEVSLSAHAARPQKSTTQITNVIGTGSQGAVLLQATITSNGAPLDFETVRFKIGGRVVGQGTSFGDGTVVGSADNLKNLRPGIFAKGLVAVFAGDTSHRGTVARGPLVISRFRTNITDVSGSGTFGGPGTLTATLSSNGQPVAGQTVGFRLYGQFVGNAVTNSQGVATLTSVDLSGQDAGDHPNSVVAFYVAGRTYGQSLYFGDLNVSPTPVNFSVSNLSQSFDGTSKTVAVTSNPPNVPYSIEYTNAQGIMASSVSAVGTYTFNLTSEDPNYTGSASGVFVIT